MTEYVLGLTSKEETAFCVKDVAGKILARGKVATDPRALFAALREPNPKPEPRLRGPGLRIRRPWRYLARVSWFRLDCSSGARTLYQRP